MGCVWRIVVTPKHVKQVVPICVGWDSVAMSDTEVELMSNDDSDTEVELMSGDEAVPEVQRFIDYTRLADPAKRLHALLFELGLKLKFEEWSPGYDNVYFNIYSPGTPSTNLIYGKILGDRMYVSSFFDDNGPPASMLVPGRTVAGIGMELVYLIARMRGCKLLSLEDDWESAKGTTNSRDLMEVPTEYTPEFADRFEQIGRRGRAYGFSDAESLARFRTRVHASGFYGAWNLHSLPGNPYYLEADVADFIPTATCF